MQIIEMADTPDGGLRITVEIEEKMLIPLAALGIKYAVLSAATLESEEEVPDEPLTE